MEKFRRIFVIVADSLGVGAMPDSPAFGDNGCKYSGTYFSDCRLLPYSHFAEAGLANITPLKQVPPASAPLAYYGKLCEKSNGKDTMTGHWEMMGLEVTRPFKTFTETGFPPELIRELENVPAAQSSGIKAPAELKFWMSLQKKKLPQVIMIVYTSAGFRYADHGKRRNPGLDELYRCCGDCQRTDYERRMAGGRVIAAPIQAKER